MRIEWERDWGKPTNESESRKLRNHTFELLRKGTRERHPILKEIKKREYEAEKLARDFPVKESDIPEMELLQLEDARPLIGDYLPPTLEKMLREVCEELGFDNERAKILRAAIAWSKELEHIDKLKQEAQKVLYSYSLKMDPSDYTKEYEARSTLESTVRNVMTQYNDDWNKDYEFRENLENFLDDIASERCYIREDFDIFRLYKNIEKYSEEDLAWHFPGITDFLLVDLIDTHLIDLERNFQFGLFSPRLANQIADVDDEDCFLPSLDLVSPTLSPKGKKKRGEWRFKNLMIGSGLICIWIESLKGKIIANLLANQGLNLPAWVFTVIGCIGISFLVLPIFSLLFEVIKKIQIGYNNLAKAAKKFVAIRFEINSGTYHAKTLIERLRKLEEQDLEIHSLIYALLELRDGRETHPEV